MRLKETIKIIDEGWVRKCMGYRVHFQKRNNGDIITDYVPGDEEKPLESEVVAWRLAWKLAQAKNKIGSEMKDKEIFNIFVVDDFNNPVKHYATGKIEVFLPINDE